MSTPAGCTLYGLVAKDADVAVVFRRGPSNWWHLASWDLRTFTFEHGARYHGSMYPRPCEISPNGELLAISRTPRVPACAQARMESRDLPHSQVPPDLEDKRLVEHSPQRGHEVRGFPGVRRRLRAISRSGVEESYSAVISQRE